METEEWPDLAVSKIDSARRQFDTAIVLWFNDGDPVSIRTLTAAAHQVCKWICEKRLKKKSPLVFSETLWGAEFEKWKKYVLQAENFFKHAEKDHDPAGTILNHLALGLRLWAADLRRLIHNGPGKLLRVEPLAL